MNKIVALLPMKANSERVKAKNFKLFNGKPLFKWILDTLLSIELIDMIVINTDAKSILLENGLQENNRTLIRERKQNLCGDMVSMNLIIEDDINAINSETYLMTHTTNPLLGKSTIENAIEQYHKNVKDGYDSLFTANKIQTRFYRKDASPINHDPDNLVRTQDLEPWYEENSNLYIFSKNSFEKTHARIGSKPFIYEMPKIESADIDDQTDWMIAEALSKYLINKNNL